jgi:hypothetical protein
MLVACRWPVYPRLRSIMRGSEWARNAGGRDQPRPPLRQQIREAKLVERLAEEMAEELQRRHPEASGGGLSRISERVSFISDHGAIS